METKKLLAHLDDLLYKGKCFRVDCIAAIDKINRRAQMLNFIKTFIGVDGFVAFEHGYKPKKYYNKFNEDATDMYAAYHVKGLEAVFGIGCNYLYANNAVEHISCKVPFRLLSNAQLKMVCKMLYEYAFYCRYTA